MNALVCARSHFIYIDDPYWRKKRGTLIFRLILNFGVLLITILIMTNPNADPIILTLIACTVISCINLFYINEVNTTTKTAFISSMITIVVLLFFIVIVTGKAMIQGFGEEEIEELGAYSLYIGVDFVKIGASVIIMSTIGAITDRLFRFLLRCVKHFIINHPSAGKSYSHLD